MDLDGGGPPPAPPPRSGRRARLVAALLALAVVGALVVAQRVERARQSRVELVAVGGELLAIGQPTSADFNTTLAVEVQLRNDGPAPVTVRSVHTVGGGERLDDDLSGGGGEARGLEQGTRLARGEVATVVLSGILLCRAAPEPPVTGDLVVVAAAADGTERTLDVAAPPGEAWSGALARGCAAGPDDGRPAMA